MRLSCLIRGALGILSASAQVGFSLPVVLDVTAEEFMKMKEFEVRSQNTTHTLVKDSICSSCSITYGYEKVGDGDPHQNFVITQKGGTLVSCSDSSDSTSSGYSTTLGWTLSVGASISAIFSSLGFSVSESETYTETNTFSCSGVAAEGGDICIMFYQAVTAFTVQIYQTISCPCGATTVNKKEQAIVYAPNAHQLGSIAGRGINVPRPATDHNVEQCVGDDDRTINYYCGPAGGPEWWNGKGDGPWVDDYVNQREPANCSIPIEAYRFTD